MSDALPPIEKFFTPQFIGKISLSGSSGCFGFAHSIDNTLIALSVMGGTTSVEAIWAAAATGEAIYVAHDDDDKEPYFSSRYGYTNGNKFRKYAVAVPNSSYVSMVLINTALESYVPSSSYCYLPLIGDKQDLRDRFYIRMTQICYLPVLEQWTDYLIEVGLAHDKSSYDRLCGELDTKSSYWVAKGFNIFWIKNSRTHWENVITKGLKAGKISIH